MLLALERGKTRICRVVQVPTPTEEDAKREHRERAVLVTEKTAHTNRIGGILMALGIRGVNPHRRDFVQRLDGLMTGTGEPLPAHTKQALAREHERLILAERQIKDIERAQASAIKAVATPQSAAKEGGTAERGGAQAAALVRLKGIGQISGVPLCREVFYRHFNNRRELASYFGLPPSPYNSGSMRVDQGVRHRTIRSRGCLSNKTALAVVFKLVEGAQKNWRRIDGHHQLPKLIQGVRFTDGIEVIGNFAAPQAQAAA